MIIELYSPLVPRKDPSEVKEAHERYQGYLRSIHDRLPPAVAAIATAPWHYDPSFHECPHDSWVQDVVVREMGVGARHEQRHIEIEIVLLGAYHDGEIRIRYEDVRGYSLTLMPADRPGNGHGDWLIDEVRLSDSGTVLHEVVLSDSRWLIECAGMEWRWIPGIP